MVTSHLPRAWLLTLAALLPFSSSLASSASSVTTPIEAIWKVQQVPFEYRSMDVYYNCDSLERKVRAILKAVGAHQSMVIQSDCRGAPANRISVKIALATPVPATEENVRIATTFDATDQLVARVKQIELPTPTDIDRFPARWETFTLARIRDITFTSGDCDLLRGLNEQVFPKLAVRVQNKVSCPGYTMRVRPNVQFEALLPASIPLQPVAQARSMSRG